MGEQASRALSIQRMESINGRPRQRRMTMVVAEIAKAPRQRARTVLGSSPLDARREKRGALNALVPAKVRIPSIQPGSAERNGKLGSARTAAKRKNLTANGRKWTRIRSFAGIFCFCLTGDSRSFAFIRGCHFLIRKSGMRIRQTSLIWMAMPSQSHADFRSREAARIAARRAATMRLSKWASAAKEMRMTGLNA